MYKPVSYHFVIQTVPYIWYCITEKEIIAKTKVTSDDVIYRFLVIYVRLVDSDVLELCPMYLYEVM